MFITLHHKVGASRNGSALMVFIVKLSIKGPVVWRIIGKRDALIRSYGKSVEFNDRGSRHEWYSNSFLTLSNMRDSCFAFNGNLH